MTPLAMFVISRRITLGVSQQQLARRMGVDGSYISMVEKGKKSPANLRFLERLAAGLALSNLETQELFEMAKRSQNSIRLPKDISVTAYLLAANFASSLEILSDEQMNFLNSAIDALKGGWVRPIC